MHAFEHLFIHAHGQNRRGGPFRLGGVKSFRAKIGQKSEKIGNIPQNSGKIAKNCRFSVIFTLKPKNFPGGRGGIKGLQRGDPPWVPEVTYAWDRKGVCKFPIHLQDNYPTYQHNEFLWRGKTSPTTTLHLMQRPILMWLLGSRLRTVLSFAALKIGCLFSLWKIIVWAFFPFCHKSNQHFSVSEFLSMRNVAKTKGNFCI